MLEGFSEEDNGLDELCTLLREEEKELIHRKESQSCARRRMKQQRSEKDTFIEEKQDSTVDKETAAMKGVFYSKTSRFWQNT